MESEHNNWWSEIFIEWDEMADDSKIVEDTHELCKESNSSFLDESSRNLFFFFQDEAQFKINGNVSEEIKFSYLVSQL